MRIDVLAAAICAAAFVVMRGRITDDGVKRIGKDATSPRIPAAAFCASVVAFGNDAKVISLSDFVKEIDGRNLVALPIGAVLAVDGANAALPGKEGVSKVAVPDNQSERAAADCAALCVSEIFVDNKTMEIQGTSGARPQEE